MSSFSSLIEKLKLQRPVIFDDLFILEKKKTQTLKCQSSISKKLPHLSSDLYEFTYGPRKTFAPLNVGVVFSGGQASGGHNVVIGLLDTLIKMSPGSKMVGFIGGPSGLIDNKFKDLNLEGVQAYRNTGGFDLIGSGRTKIETPEQFDKTLETLKQHKIQALVIIGGDDSNTNAALLANFLIEQKYPCQVIGIPKTIDGDLKNEHIEVSFGFDTASKLYAELIGNLERDCLSAKKYTHFIKVMGRSASHLVLEAALIARPNLALISEEILEKKLTLKQVVLKIADLIETRSKSGKNYGVILIPEGLIEAILEIGKLISHLNTLLADLSSQEAIKKLTKDEITLFKSLPITLQEQLLTDRDPHGNVNVSIIETEKMLMQMVQEELKARKFTGKFAPLAHFFGYEGRACYPSYFDAHYGYMLGVGAAVLIQSGLTGYMVGLKHLGKNPKSWTLEAVPLISMMHMEERKGAEKAVIKKALVDLKKSRFTQYQKLRDKDALEDHYQFPGPMQYFGDETMLYNPPLLASEL